MIDCGELVTDIELSEALEILEKPELKIYKK